MPSTLAIYISDDCPTCAETKGLARAVSERYPDLDVNLINLSHSGVEWPEKVFAVPTYVCDDRIIFLGNPSLKELDAYFMAVSEP